MNNTPGLINWAAGSDGVSDAIAIEKARDTHQYDQVRTEALKIETADKHEQMREETRALMQQNDDNDMTLAERAVHHAAWMKNNQDGQYEARMAKMMAIEDAKLTNEYLEADKITRANNKVKGDYEQIVANQLLMDRALQTIATQKPANAIVLSRIFAQTFAGNNDPLVLDTMLKLNALSDAGMQEFDTHVNWVIDNTTDDPEVLKKSQTSIVRMADNIITQADPDLRETLGKHFAARLDSYSQRDDQRKAREHEMQIESYMAQTGVSRSAAELALKKRDILLRHELSSLDDQMKINDIMRGVEMMQQKLDFARLSGAQEMTSTDQQKELGRMQAAAEIKLAQTIQETSNALAELDAEENDLNSRAPVRTFGTMKLGEYADTGFWDSWEFVWSKAQDNALIEANTRIAELQSKIPNASPDQVKKYREAIHQFETFKREISWYGGVHIIPKAYKQKMVAAKNDLQTVTNRGSVGDFEESINAMKRVIDFYDSIYTPESVKMEQIQSKREGLYKTRKEAQDHVDYGNSLLIRPITEFMKENIEINEP